MRSGRVLTSLILMFMVLEEFLFKAVVTHHTPITKTTVLHIQYSESLLLYDQ